MRIRIAKRSWRLVFCRLPNRLWGRCSNPDIPPRLIEIDERAKGRRRLQIILHEFYHAQLWQFDEAAIDQLAIDTEALLWKLGYRPTEPS